VTNKGKGNAAIASNLTGDPGGVDFEIDLRGHVQRSEMRASTRPDLQQRVPEYQQQWIDSIATRNAPCVAKTFSGTQDIEFTRRDGRLSMALEPARVQRTFNFVVR
jgi:hypothetical protein